jgi:4,5-epoxidase
MSEATSTQVLIVGAGPTGLALACHLLRLGVRVRLIDLKPGTSTTSKAVGLQYRVSEILACMGIVDRFVERAGSPSKLNLYSGGQHLLRLDIAGFGETSGRDAFSPRVLLLPQSETETILAEEVRKRGGTVEWNTAFLGFEHDAGRVVSRLRAPDGTEEEVRSDWLVSCEGAHSVVRRQAGLSLGGKTYPLAFVLADVELDAPWDRTSTHAWLHPEGAVAAMPLPAPGVWRLIVELTRHNEEAAGEVTLDQVRELLAHRTGNREAKIGKALWISEYRIHCRMVDHYRRGRVFLAGDAAHLHSPSGGQGIVTGIQDATNLAWKLARVLKGAPESLLDTYEEERLPAARDVLRQTDRTTTLMMAPTRWTRLVRDYLLLPLMRMKWVQKKMFSRMAQLHVNYRESGLSRHQDSHRWPWTTRIRAGDRAPDVAFESSSGAKTTLFDLLGPMRPVVLIGPGNMDEARVRRLLDALDRHDVAGYLVVGPGDDRWHSEPRCLVDVHGDFRRLYGMTGEFLCLVRPDDHVGLFQRPISELALGDYLAKLCGAGEAHAVSRDDCPPVILRREPGGKQLAGKW